MYVFFAFICIIANAPSLAIGEVSGVDGGLLGC